MSTQRTQTPDSVYIAHHRAVALDPLENDLGLPLRVIGDGEMRGTLKKRAKPNIQFLGRVGDDELRHNLARCRALVFPGEEDFGIVPVEAMASGRPVIAYGRDGVLDTVVDGVTGVLFKEPSVEALVGAVRRYQNMRDGLNPELIAQHARAFDKSIFMEQMTEVVQGALAAESRWRPR
jgi:glycosyltransferase involved in cell wall biosynthesis